jgi:hypothetical protein
MNRLLEIGFDPAGHWLLENDTLGYSLARHSTRTNILYAFVSDGQIMYVGKTVKTLKQRMSGYMRPSPTQSTNLRNRDNIRLLLAQGAAVDILALPDNGLLHYGQFHLNLAAALEDDLIRVIDPPWNGGRVDDGIHPPAPPAECIAHPDLGAEPPAHAVGAFAVVLQSTYFAHGFFNVGVAFQALLGADGETIEMLLGDEVQPILGTINRRANANGTPRIMGGAGLRGWFHTAASVAATISVEVYSPTSIRLRAPQQDTGSTAHSDPPLTRVT